MVMFVKMSSLTKKVATLLLTFAMIYTLAMPAFATSKEPGIQPFASGNGWTSTSIVKNGVSYTATAGTGLDSSNRAYTALETSCRCTRTHSIVTMTYKAESDGNAIAKSDGPVTHSDVAGTTESKKTQLVSYYGPFLSCRSITGTVNVKVVNQDGYTTTYNFNPKLTNY